MYLYIVGTIRTRGNCYFGAVCATKLDGDFNQANL